MYAIATIRVCFLLAGCMAGERDATAGERWITGPTKAVCEQRLVEAVKLSAEAAGDEVVFVHAVCERVGA